MTKLIVLLVITSAFQISVADVTTVVESSEAESQSSSESSSETFSTSSSSSETEIVDSGPPETPPPKCTKPNEVLEICPAKCPFRTCGIDDTLVLCAPSPRPGDKDCPPPDCRCKPQFFRDDKGNCVPWKKCPKCKKNEVYDPCDTPCPLRECSVDPRLIRCAAPPELGDPDCVKGCRCIDGYARTSEGICVPRDECPPKEPECGVNEEYDPCPDCSPQTCETMNAIYHCPEIPANKTGPGCNPSCRCKKGFFRNTKGECIPACECPPSKCTKPNEILVVCPARCPFRTCGIDDTLIDCAPSPQPGDPNCPPPECQCKPQFFRDDKGNCVPWKKCPKCKKNEVYDPCDTPCPLRRCDVDPRVIKCAAPPELGDPDCVKGCRCIDGYARTSDGICVPRDKCPPKQPACGVNEEYDPCPDCSPQTCETMNKTYHCPKIPADKKGPGCNPSCRCKKGFYRNLIGECISASDCLRCTKKHEYYSCGGACDNECDTIREQNQTSCPIINVKCNEKCYCEKNYARDYKKDCIPIKDCPVCPPNEKYDPCPATLCAPKTCDEAGFPLNCTQREEGAPCPGKPGCVCRDGYLRNKKGICVRTDQCPSCGGDKNATYGCGVNCNRHCSNLNQTEPEMCILVCYPNSCDCRTDKDGNDYYYDDNLKQCVLPKDCTPQCKKNEVYSECVNGGCGKQKCTDINKPVVCVHPKICKTGCICAPGFLRAKNGTCVPSEQCDPPPKCKPNEEFSKCGRDGCLKYYCSDLDLPPLCRDTFQCIPQCECKEGFLRASTDNNTCVPIKQCPRKCKENEEYSECPSASCTPKTCKEAGYPVPCPIVGPDGQCSGEPGCICISGYLRNNKGICIPQNQCPSCGGDKNAVPGCGNHCGNTCATYNSTKPIACPLFCNLNGCDCKKKYVYDGNLRKCVLPEKCTPTCKENEEFSTCVQGVCRPLNCTDKGKNLPCPDIAEGSCISGCICKEGFLKAKNGTCVPSDQCDNRKCNENEQYSDCPMATCQPQSCKQAGYPIPCPMLPPDGKCPGGPGCICKPGFLRNDKGIFYVSQRTNASCATYNKKLPCPLFCNKNGCDCKDKYVFDENLKKCVLIKNCTPICKENEEFSACIEGVCRIQNCTEKGNVIACPAIPPPCCTAGCVCKEGYLRAKNGTCVPEDQCDCKKCDENEEYSDCPYATCEPQTCKQAGYPVPCPLMPPGGRCPSGPGCLCKPGYLRDCKGKCIPKKLCPSCGGDDNAFPGCGNHCGNSCATYNKTVQCPLFCHDNGCDCKEKHVFDDNLGKCVLIKDCTPTCDTYEEFSACIEGVCRIQNCTDKGNDIACPAIPPNTCTAGCVCKEGHLRAKNGTCVPEDQCDHKTCNENEEYSDCPFASCLPKTCKEAGYPIPCPSIPPGGECPGGPGCICSSGFLRDDKGKCIPEKLCPSCGGDKNAVPGCGNHCGNSCANYDKKVFCLPFCKINSCDCKENHVFDDNLGKCVLLKDCTPTCTGYEEFTTCIEGVCRIQDCSQKGNDIACPAIPPNTCTAGCVCMENYLRAKNGTCVHEDDCEPCGPSEPTCPEGEVMSKCPPVMCDAEYCPKYRDNPKSCPNPPVCLPPRCLCGFNSHRDRKTGKCIPTAKCPPFPCNGPNEKYQPCPPVCPGETCTDYLKNATCPKFKIGVVVPCDPDCRCVKGYYRNSKGICIEAKKCKDSVCKANEEYTTCTNGLCRVQDCADKGKEIPCPIIGDDCCIPGCVCKRKFLRDQYGKCVPEDQCDETDC